MGRRDTAWQVGPPPRKGGGVILTGMLLVVGTFIYIVLMALAGGTHTLYTLIPLLVGLPLLMVGLAKRGSS